MSKAFQKILKFLESEIEDVYEEEEPFRIFLAGMRFYQKVNSKSLSSSKQRKQL